MELHNFDKANFYRSYQFSLIKKYIKKEIRSRAVITYILMIIQKFAKNYIIEPTKKILIFKKEKSCHC